MALEKLNEAPLPYHAGSAASDMAAQRRSANRSRAWSTLRVLCQWVLAFAACYVGLTTLQGKLAHMESGAKKTNIILMISDGYGPASETFSRAFHHALKVDARTNATRYPAPRPLDKILVGSHRSCSSDSLITDSAAGATAFSCGRKSYNGAIGVDEEAAACGTVFEAAKEKGWATGVVVTSRLTDATPACFVAHVPSRGQEALIAAHSLGLGASDLNLSSTGHLGPGRAPLARPLDLAIGGGGCYYLPQSHPHSCRQDDADLVGAARERGWDVLLGAGFDSVAAASKQSGSDVPHASDLPHPLPGPIYASATDSAQPIEALLSDPAKSKVKLPLLALLAPFNTPYEIDRLALPPAQQAHFPPLHKLATGALNLLSGAKENKKGLLLMVEGSQIDLCAHTNDPACHGRETEAYQQTIEAVRSWVEAAAKRGERSVIISTSDHETGGMTLARQLTSAYPNYAYYPSRLVGVKASATSLSARLVAFARTDPAPAPEVLHDFVLHDILGPNGTDFTGEQAGGKASEAEVKKVLGCIATTQQPEEMMQDPPINTADTCRRTLADLMSRRAEIGWSTTGHSGVDVPVHFFASHNWHRGRLVGNIENTEIGEFIAESLGLDLEAVTKALRKKR